MKLMLSALVLSLLMAGSAMAHPSGHGGDHAPAPRPQPPTPEQTVAPDTYPEVVAALREELAAAHTAIKASRILDLRRSCESLKALGEAVPNRTSSLPEEAQATAKMTVTALIGRVADALTAADGGDLPSAKASLDGVSKDLEVLAGLGE